MPHVNHNSKVRQHCKACMHDYLIARWIHQGQHKRWMLFYKCPACDKMKRTSMTLPDREPSPIDGTYRQELFSTEVN